MKPFTHSERSKIEEVCKILEGKLDASTTERREKKVQDSVEFLRYLLKVVDPTGWPQNYTDQECIEKINKVFVELKFEPSDAEHYTWGHKEDVPKALIICGKALEEIRDIVCGQYEIG